MMAVEPKPVDVTGFTWTGYMADVRGLIAIAAEIGIGQAAMNMNVYIVVIAPMSRVPGRDADISAPVTHFRISNGKACEAGRLVRPLYLIRLPIPRPGIPRRFIDSSPFPGFHSWVPPLLLVSFLSSLESRVLECFHLGAVIPV